MVRSCCEITGEHILRGALRDNDAQDSRVLANLGVQVEAVESRLDQLAAKLQQADR